MNPNQRFAGLTPELVRSATEIAQALEQRRLEDAERGVIAALALAPKHPELLRLYGLTQFARGRSEEQGIGGDRRF